MSLLNDLQWIAELQKIEEIVDDNDRPVEVRTKVRDLYYIEIGITAEEKYLSQQAKTDVVRRIKCRWDKSITEKTNGVKIDGIAYNIARIYTLPKSREMELSLTYVN
ncbi:phage head closure protein [Enterococcus faecium]|uniref:phage head closure protein n=1 Tax=Enterococcus TaxID=1350 RepID=UPI0012E1D19C|nr:phage head closure protein [Enterococcus gallinarum]MCR1932645.1 phage head closure protein [Enterococcus gallinarum]MDV7787647.1 phage head closure protein [Enterococcus gallinarum]MUO33108.1 phage head closure protein [Enterococcus gallinarum]